MTAYNAAAERDKWRGGRYDPQPVMRYNELVSLLYVMLSILKVKFIYTACNRLRLSMDIPVLLTSLLKKTRR